MRDLAGTYRGTFHLVGRSPLPDEPTRRDAERLRGDREALKREIFARLKAAGARATPAAVEKRLLELERAASIVETLAAVAALGAEAVYHAGDVTDPVAMAAVVEAVRRQSGRVDVLVHAAGIERSRSLADKPAAEWDRIFSIKADGLCGLLAATREAGVRALVCFSSVAGRFGNAGQTDYAAGNDLCAKVAAAWAASRPGAQGTVIDWSAWAEVGMAARGSVPEMMRRAGIEPLVPGEAAPVVRHALATGLCGEIVVGRKLGALLLGTAPDGGIDASAVRERRGAAAALPFEAAALHPAEGLRIEVTIDPRREPFLSDHEIDGTPVLPGVMGLEAFAEAATLLAPGWRVMAITHVRFLAPLKYYRREPRPATLRALALRAGDGRLAVRTTLSAAQAGPGRPPQEQEKLHFSATVWMEPDAAPATPPSVQPDAGDGRGDGKGAVSRDAIYRVYFHGPAYRVLSRVERTRAGAVEGALFADLPAETSSPTARWVFSPRLVELCFQTAGVWEIGATGKMALPAAVDRVAVWAAPPDAGPLVAEVVAKSGDGAGSSPEGPSFDAIVRGEDGRVYVEVTGYRTARVPGGLAEADVAPFRAVAGPAGPAGPAT